MLDKKVKKTGLTTSSLLRMLITNYKQKEKPPQEFYDSINYIRKVGNALNQIAVRTHMTSYVKN